MDTERKRSICSRRLCRMSTRRVLRLAWYRMSWKRMSASTILSNSPLSINSLISTRIRSSDSSSSGVIRSAARPADSSSRALRISNTWAMSFSEMSATYVPRRGTMTTKPSCSSWRMASRIGVRLTPSSSASWISMSRSPGLSRPSFMAWRKVLLTTSRRGL